MESASLICSVAGGQGTRGQGTEEEEEGEPTTGGEEKRGKDKG